MRFISYILLLLIIVLGVSFASLNPGLVTINYYLGHQTMALSLLLVIIFSTGCLLGLAVGLWLLVKSKFRLYQIKSKLKMAEQEINNLRAIPLQDKH